MIRVAVLASRTLCAFGVICMPARLERALRAVRAGARRATGAVLAELTCITSAARLASRAAAIVLVLPACAACARSHARGAECARVAVGTRRVPAGARARLVLPSSTVYTCARARGATTRTERATSALV